MGHTLNAGIAGAVFAQTVITYSSFGTTEGYVGPFTFYGDIPGDPTAWNAYNQLPSDLSWRLVGVACSVVTNPIMLEVIPYLGPGIDNVLDPGQGFREVYAVQTVVHGELRPNWTGLYLPYGGTFTYRATTGTASSSIRILAIGIPRAMHQLV